MRTVTGRALTPSELTRRIDGWLFAPGSFETLRWVRLAFAVTIGIRAVAWPFRALGDTPNALFSPPPVISWIPGFPPPGWIITMQVVGAAAAAYAVVRHLQGRTAESAFLAAWLAFLVLGALKTSTGKVLHNDVLLVLASFPIAMSRASKAEDSRGGRDGASGWPVRSALALTVGVYVACGYQKLRHTGPEWVFSDNMRWILEGGRTSGRLATTAVADWMIDHPLVCIAGAAALVGLELAFPVTMFVPRVRVLFAGAAVAMHSMTWLTLGLDYWAWSITAVVVLLAVRDQDRRPKDVVTRQAGAA